MPESESGMLKSLELAIRTETDGRKFYKEARDRASNSLAKGVFATLVREEQYHLNTIRRFHRELKEKGEWPEWDAAQEAQDIAGVARTVFQEAMEHFDQEANVDEGASDAYKRAMDLEQKACSMYQQLKSETTDARARKLYEFMEIQENRHYAFLEESLEYLNNPLKFLEYYPRFEGRFWGKRRGRNTWSNL